MVGIFVDHDVVGVPVPVIDESKIKGSDAEVEAAKPETAWATASDAPDMSAAEATVEVAMLPGMVEVEAGIFASGLVSHPLAVVVNMWRFGMAFAVAHVRRGLGEGSVRGGRTMFRNESAANGVAATTSVATMLREGGDGKNHRQSERCGEQSHVNLHGVTYHRQGWSSIALTILCRLRYRKDFGGRVVARLMAWRPR